ncbi:MAG: DUF4838 domain-containing protein [Kiritimatiellia bacterium]
MKRKLSLLCVLLASCLAAGAGRADFEIVRDGKPLADIVITPAPPRAVKLAAMELQEYICKISGAKLPVATAPGKDFPVHIYVGQSAFTDKLDIRGDGLKYGAFRIVSGPNYLVLLGRDRDFIPPLYGSRKPEDLQLWDERTGEKWVNPMRGWEGSYSPAAGICDFDERGSLNAVYELLRSLGVRWYMTGDLGEILPAKMANIIIPDLNREVHPDFPYRDLGSYSPGFHFGSRDAILYHLRIGLDPSPANMGRDWPHGLNNVHGREETKKAHPEYYALYDGKRSIGDKGAGHPCLSSKGLFDSTVNFARMVFDIYPDKPTIGVMPQDAYICLCQCELCKGKDTPERGWNGVMSDYVWDFVNRVAIEVYKTHPDRKVVNSAYGSYYLPPLKIDKFSPNVAIFVDEERIGFTDPEKRKKVLEFRKSWQDKLAPGNLYSSFYYLFSRPGCDTEGIPIYLPHGIAENLRSLKGVSQGEFDELSQGPDDMHAPGFNHLNVYFTARFLWDAGQDVDKMLEEYYRLYYGPAAGEMKNFIEYSEKNWPLMKSKVEPIDKAFELLDKARRAAGETVYGRRIDLIVDYVQPMKKLREKLSQGRKGVPQAVAVERKRIDLKLDGRLDKPFWKDAPVYELKELVTGKPPEAKTTFQVAWCDDRSIVFGIRCEEPDMKGLKIATTNNEDANIFNGDLLELQIETPAHAYYQVVVNPAKALIDLDRKEGIDSLWSSEAKIGSHIGDTFWSLEICLPTSDWIEGGLDPLKKINGKRPGADAPWYFEVCRSRFKGGKEEASAFSPTGVMNFHVPLKFGELIVK